MSVGVVVAALAIGSPRIAGAQSAVERLRAQRDSLDRIKREREELERRMRELRGRAHSLTEEVRNLVEQTEATARAVRTLDAQLAAVTDEVSTTTAQLVRAQDELAVKRATLQRRLTDIYKRGPLFSLEVILSSESFGELIARYKYLHELAVRDKAMVQRVRQLAEQIDRQRRSLVRLQLDVTDTRDQRAREEQHYRALEEERQASLRGIERDATDAERRLAAIARDEAKLSAIISALEAERRRSAGGASTAARVSGATLFRPGADLDWPVEGNLIYPFGRAEGPDRTTISWGGIGIQAPAGTPVRAVAAGTVQLVDPHFGTYGATVMIAHPSGEYSVYCSLAEITVVKGDIVDRGEPIGTVGTNDPRLPPHLHFEIRSGGTALLPVNPVPFLRPRR